MTSRLNWRRRHYEALTGRAPAAYSAPSRLQDVVVPDLSVATWLPFLLPRARSVSGADVAITSSPPPSVHFAGRALQAGWIAELRDGWTFEPPRQAWPLALQRRTDAAFERRTLSRASAVVAVTQPIVDDLRDRLGIDAHLITNGFDPEESPPPLGGVLDAGRHSLVHTGRMSMAGSSPKPLLEALRRIDASRLEVVFAGPLAADEAELLAAPDLAGVVKTLGPLDRDEALGLQRAADSLLVVTEGPSRSSVATGKLYEYLAARKPILVLGEGTAAAETVSSLGTGVVVSSDDPEAIAEGLRRLVMGGPQASDTAAIEPFSYQRLAAQMAEVIERVRSRPTGSFG
jgi:glycosyltransferase involved in cell wall biosynthesis